MQTNSTERPYHTCQWQTPDVSAIYFFLLPKEKEKTKKPLHFQLIIVILQAIKPK